MSYGNPAQQYNIGDKISLRRRHSAMNGWSLRPDLDGTTATIVEIEDRVNGGLTVTNHDGSRGFIFQDAIGHVIQRAEVTP